MSINISYFFNSEKTIDQLCSELNTSVGLTLAPYDGDSENLFCRHLGIELSLGTHSLENDDGGLEFEYYTYELDTRTSVGASRFRSIQLGAIANLAYSLHLVFGISGMLVFDTQILLARYENRGDTLFDLVSSTNVQFPQHLLDLYSCLPDGATDSAWEAGTIELLRDHGHNVRIPKCGENS